MMHLVVAVMQSYSAFTVPILYVLSPTLYEQSFLLYFVGFNYYITILAEFPPAMLAGHNI